MWKAIPAIFLLIVGFITYLFFSHYTGAMIPHPFLFELLGIALFLAAIIWISLVRIPIKGYKRAIAAMIS